MRDPWKEWAETPVADLIFDSDGQLRKDTDERAERPVLIREFEVRDVSVDGRTVDVRVVPFGEVAKVADPPDFHPYDEEWLPGVFDHQINAANRIHAKYGHSSSVVDVVGHGIALRAEPGDGYHIATKIHQTIQGETALELLRDGALPCVSLEARPVRSVRSATGVVQRVKANLTGFAFCRQGAFAGARVLAIREETAEEVVLDEQWLPIHPDTETIERCRRLGIKIPQRLKAHPAETGTPEHESGTPGDGTRQDQETESSEV